MFHLLCVLVSAFFLVSVKAGVPGPPQSARVRIIDDNTLEVTVEPPADDGVHYFNVTVARNHVKTVAVLYIPTLGATYFLAVSLSKKTSFFIANHQKGHSSSGFQRVNSVLYYNWNDTDTTSVAPYLVGQGALLSWYQNSDAISWDNLEVLCYNRNQRFCTDTEVCSNDEVVGGLQSSSDAWCPVVTTANPKDYIQCGTAHTPCKKLTSAHAIDAHSWPLGNERADLKDAYSCCKHSFSKMQEIATDGASHVEYFIINGEEFVFVSNVFDGYTNSHTTHSNLYKWNKNALVFALNQSITTQGCTASKHFVIGGNIYLLLVEYNSTSSRLLKWEGRFVIHSNISTKGATDGIFFEMNGKYFIGIANYIDFGLETRLGHVSIFSWNNNKFDIYQNISTNGAHDLEAFQIEEKRFLAIAQYCEGWTGGQNWELESPIYLYNEDTMTWEVYQTISTSGAIRVHFFNFKGLSFLVFASHYSQSDNSYNRNSPLYKWNGTRFLLHTTIATKGARMWNYFQYMNRTDYLFVANSRVDNDFSVNSVLYRLELKKENFKVLASDNVTIQDFNLVDPIFLEACNDYGCSPNVNVCVDGTFLLPGSQRCQSSSDCTAGQYISTNGTSTTDRVCSNCAASTYSTSTNAFACADWTHCATGQYISTNGTSSTDRACVACPTGKFSTATNQVSCTNWTACNETQVESSAGSATADRVCAPAGSPSPSGVSPSPADSPSPDSPSPAESSPADSPSPAGSPSPAESSPAGSPSPSEANTNLNAAGGWKYATALVAVVICALIIH
jgi:hypothetical protein